MHDLITLKLITLRYVNTFYTKESHVTMANLISQF